MPRSHSSSRHAPDVPITHAVQYGVFRVFAHLLRLLPPAGVAVVGRALGRAVRVCVPSRRAIAAENVAYALGATCSAAQQRTIVGDAFAAGGQLFCECLLLAEGTRHIHRGVSIEGLAHLADARAGGRGVLLFTGHLGNWELIGPRLVAAGVPTTLLVGKQRNARIDAWLNAGRRAAGQGVVPLAGGGRVAMRRLQRGECVGVLVDQRLRRGGVMVPYFGRQAATSPAAARLALAADVPVLPVSVVRAADGVRHTVTVEPALEFTPSGDRDRDVLRLTRAMTTALERIIIAAPGQYYWFHRRWKPPSDQPAAVWTPDLGL